MKRVLTLLLCLMLAIPNIVFANDTLVIESRQQIGNLIAAYTEDGSYVLDSDENIIAGAFLSISDNCGYVYAVNFDGSKVMLDLDGTVLAEVGSEGEIIAPKNGIYAVMEDSYDYTLCRRFVLYDYQTRTVLHTFDRAFLYYLEQQTDKMFIAREGKYALTDKYGNMITDYIYDDVKKRFNPEYVPFPKSYAIVIIDGEAKYIDWDLNEIDLDDYNGEPFITDSWKIQENIYVVESGDESALYDLAKGEYLTEYQSEYTYSCMNDEYIIVSSNIGKSGVLTLSQGIIVPIIYNSLIFNENNEIEYSYYDGESMRTGILDLKNGAEIESEFGGSGMFYKALGLTSMSDIESAEIVYGNGTYARLSSEDLERLLGLYWNFEYERVISPEFNAPDEYAYYIKLYSGDKSYTIFENAAVIAGLFGYPVYDNDTVYRNYVWYMPYIGNARNALYSFGKELSQKYSDKTEISTDMQVYDMPSDEDDMLPLDGTGDWAQTEIQRAAAKNLLIYSLTDKYKESITRVDFCQLAARLIATEIAPKSDSRLGIYFALDNYIDQNNLRDKFDMISYNDCDDEYIRYLSAMGIIDGVGEGEFAPNNSLTREQAAVILNRIRLLFGTETKGDTDKFLDDEDISDWARDGVYAVKAAEIMNGIGDNMFAPQSSYTVEQSIATILRLYELNN